MKMFETKIGTDTIAWIVGENGVKKINQVDYDTGSEVTVILDNEKLGEVRVTYQLKQLPFYATA